MVSGHAGDVAAMIVKRHGRTVAAVAAPHAVDARGAVVPVHWRVRGTSLLVSVAHRTGNWLFPIHVDPYVSEDQRYWSSNAAMDFTGWTTASNRPAGTFGFFAGTTALGRGLYISSTTGSFGNGDYGEWVFQAMGAHAGAFASEAAHIFKADFGFTTNGVAGPGPSCVFEGIFSTTANAFESGVWRNATASSTPPYLPSPNSICAPESGQYRVHCLSVCPPDDSGSPNVGTPGNEAILAQTMSGAGTRTSAGLVYMASSLIYESETAIPHMGATTAAPATWTRDFTMSQSATDYGVGLIAMSASAPSWTGFTENNTQLDGSSCITTNGTSGAGGTPGTAHTGDRNHRCLAPQTLSISSQGRTGPGAYPALPDGSYPVHVSATDVLGNPAAIDLPVKVDRTAPTVSLSGSLKDHAGVVPLTDPSYQLHIDANDGAARSGVSQINVSISNTGQPADTQTFTNAACGQDKQSCTASFAADLTYMLATSKPGPHTVSVTAIDAAGNVSTAATFDFTTLAPVVMNTGALGLERYYQYDTTPTGPGSAAHVNLANGNLVWHDQLLSNRGRGLNTFAALTYNDMQPLSGLGLLAGLGTYNQAGQGFSLAISGITRVNEPLAIDQLTGHITLTDADGTQHVFIGDPTSPQLGLGTIGLLPTRYSAPSGVHLRLRRFATSGDRTWAATRPDGVTYYFNAAGYATSIQDRNANKISYTYQYALPLQSQLPLLLQGVTGLACNTASGVLQSGLPLVQNLITLLGSIVPLCTPQLTTVTDAAGRQLTLAYDSGKVRTITDHAGRVTLFGYDANGITLQSVTSASGTPQARSYRFSYSAAQLPSGHRDLTAICDPRSSLSDACGVATSNTTTVAYSGMQSLTTAGASVIGLKDRRDHSTTYGYSGTQGDHFTQAVVTDALSHATTYAFDTASRPTGIVDALGRDTELGWDGANNLQSVTLAKGASDEATTDYTYNQNGLLLTKTDPQTPDGKRHTTTLSYYDSAGDQASAIANADTPANFVSDLKSVTTPRGSVSNDTYTTDFAYTPDGHGNLQTITEPASTNAANGQSTRGVVRATYDSLGQLSSQTNETGDLTTFPTYDANGLPVVKIDPRGNASHTDPNIGRWLYSYDAVGNLKTETDPRGATSSDTQTSDPNHRYTTSYTYDNLDRLTQSQTPRLSDRSETDNLGLRFVVRKWEYDNNDNPVTMADAVGSGDLTGDLAHDAASTKAYHTDYNAMDEPTQQRTPAVAHDGEASAVPETTTLGYDEVDNLASIQAPMGGAPGSATGSYTTMFGYDQADQRVSDTRQQVATDGTTKKLVTSRAFDTRGNVIGVADPVHNARTSCHDLGAVQAAKTVGCQRYAMSYDKADNLLHRVENPTSNPSSSDTEHDLDTASEYYEDDKVKTVTDPRAQKSHPSGDSYVTAYSFDERGQRTDVTNPVGDKTSWRYDLAGRLAKLIKPNGTATSDTAGDYETQFTYDPDGYLTDQTVPRAAGQYGSTGWKTHYTRNPVGDATTVIDPRGHTFTNTYYDSGELRTTDRPSWFGFSGPAAPDGVPQAGQTAAGATTAGDDSPEISMLSYDQIVAQAHEPAPPLPSSPAQGSGGAVDPVPVPGVVPRAGQTTFVYDSEMRLTKVDDVHGTHNTLERDPLGRIASTTQQLDEAHPDGSMGGIAPMVRAWTYDRDGNVATFDSGDRVGGVKAMTTYGYDQFDRLTSTSVPGSGDNGTETTSFGYDANDNQTSTTSALNHVTTLGYDDDDRLTTKTNPENEVTGFGYDPAGNQHSVTTPRGMALAPSARDPYTTTTIHNGANELASRTDGLGNRATYGYDHDGNQISETDPGAANQAGGDPVDRHITRTFDGRDLPWTVSTNDGLGNPTKRTTVTEFDANGDLRRTVNPAGVGSNDLPNSSDDGEGALSITSPANRDATVREYDENGLMLHVDLPKGPTTSGSNDDHLFRSDYTYTPVGFIDTISLPHDITTGEPAVLTAYGHLRNGWLRSASDPAHVAAGSQAPVQQVLRYTYDNRGDQTSWTRDAQNGEPVRIITRTFATDGTLSSRIATKGSSAERSYVYKYDKDRLLKSTVEDDESDHRSGATETFTYDAANRLKNANDSLRGTDTHMTYYAGGLIHTRQTDGNLGSDGVSYTGGKTTTFTYDSLDRQQTMTVDPGDDPSDGPNRTTTFDYYPSGDQLRQTDPNGVQHNDYYDATGQIVGKQRVKNGATTDVQAYTYDANSNRTADEKGTEHYNSRNQLVQWLRTAPGSGTVDYVLTGSGAVKSITDSNGPDNVLTLDGDRVTKAVTSDQGQSATFDYNYDGFGNLLQIHREGGPTTNDTTYTYDSFERMIASHDPAQTPATSTYTYDALDRRDTQTQNGTVTTYGYIGSSHDLAQEIIGSGGSKRSYDYDAAGNRQGQQVVSSATTTYRTYVSDAQGSVLGFEDSAGHVQDGTHYRYDPYGAIVNQDGQDPLNQTAKDNPFRFQSFYYDPTASGYDEQAREYRPDIQRFLTQDRYEAALGDLSLATDPLLSDRYAYLAGNPTTIIEYDGHTYRCAARHPETCHEEAPVYGHPGRPGNDAYLAPAQRVQVDAVRQAVVQLVPPQLQSVASHYSLDEAYDFLALYNAPTGSAGAPAGGSEASERTNTAPDVAQAVAYINLVREGAVKGAEINADRLRQLLVLARGGPQGRNPALTAAVRKALPQAENLLHSPIFRRLASVSPLVGPVLETLKNVTEHHGFVETVVRTALSVGGELGGGAIGAVLCPEEVATIVAAAGCPAGIVAGAASGGWLAGKAGDALYGGK